jgi:archaellum component FlaC
MILGILTLLTALLISGIAAYYSIVGLTAIFAAVFWPIVVMGSVLELGKVVTTLWLHYNWDKADWKIKSYLCTAVGVLMLITSMGIFGYLSKAHLDQAVPSSDVQAQVSLFDEKIKTQRDNIDSSRRALTQMDASVDQILSRTTDETGASKSATLRKAQQKERSRLQSDIDLAQKEISKLQEQRAPVASTLRKVEAEVGPIKYIAALIYGDNTDQNTLEAAVRWVIIIIVFVFDPLAIVLILAATTSIDWARTEKRKQEGDLLVSDHEKQLNEITATYLEETKLLTECIARLETELDATKSTLDGRSVEWQDKETELQQISASLAEIMEYVATLNHTIENLQTAYTAVSDSNRETQRELNVMISEYDTLLGRYESVVSEHAAIQSEIESMLQAPDVVQFMQEEKAVEVEPVVEAVVEVDPVVTEPSMPVRPVVELPELVHAPVTKIDTSFGVTFPATPHVGDMFLRMDFMPSKLFKWTGDEWIVVDKSGRDIYADDVEYIRTLIKLVESGEYDVDDLSETEQAEMAKLLAKEIHD